MKAFADLYSALDETNKTSEKVAALTRYFEAAAPEDAAWAVYFLTGRKPRQVVPVRKLAAWAAEAGGLADWLFEECYHATGDLAEAISLILPVPAAASDASLWYWIEKRLLPLRGLPEDVQKKRVLAAWAELDRRQRFVWNKLTTGAFRVGVSHQLVVRALAAVSGRSPATISHRLMGDWEPGAAFYSQLGAEESASPQVSQPYPFFLAHPLEGDPADLGALADWQAEWKWDGIRAQLIRRGGQTFLWSRGEELVTARFPEVARAGAFLPDGTVLDGEILAWLDDNVQPFACLQHRIGRKAPGKKLLEQIPVILMAYDLMEHEGSDIRQHPLAERRARLEALAPHGQLLSPLLGASSWAELKELWQGSRERGVEGIMLKRRSSPYRVGRQRGDWWKWKVAPHTVDAVLIYAQRGSGKRASLYTDYTFALWHEGALVPVAKAYSGLTDQEIHNVDSFVRRHTLEKFGPVRTVTPELVFELAFEGIQRSTRHKSGIAVRFPRILRWRLDKKPAEADTLDRLRAMLPDI